MREGNKKVGILGGTFNPIHYGHLIIAETVRERFSLEKVLFIPSGNPPHKRECEVEEADRRFEMAAMAVSGNPFFEASRMEIDRVGLTYTVDTLRALRALLGDDTGLYFIVGADVIPELTTWKSCTEVFGLCDFIAVHRPGFDDCTFRLDIGELKKKYTVTIHEATVPLIDISSTDIRERIKSGRSIRYLTPESVGDYICKNGLYRE